MVLNLPHCDHRPRKLPDWLQPACGRVGRCACEAEALLGPTALFEPLPQALSRGGRGRCHLRRCLHLQRRTVPARRTATSDTSRFLTGSNRPIQTSAAAMAKARALLLSPPKSGISDATQTGCDSAATTTAANQAPMARPPATSGFVTGANRPVATSAAARAKALSLFGDILGDSAPGDETFRPPPGASLRVSAGVKKAFHSASGGPTARTHALAPRNSAPPPPPAEPPPPPPPPPSAGPTRRRHSAPAGLRPNGATFKRPRPSIERLSSLAEASGSPAPPPLRQAQEGGMAVREALLRRAAASRAATAGGPRDGASTANTLYPHLRGAIRRALRCRCHGSAGAARARPTRHGACEAAHAAARRGGSSRRQASPLHSAACLNVGVAGHTLQR